MDNVTPVSIPDIPFLLVITWADCTLAVIATTTRTHAGLRTTETAPASRLVLPPERLLHAAISADIMISQSNGVSTIRAVAIVLTTARVDSATGTGTQASQVKVARLLEDIGHTDKMNLDDMVMRAIFRNYSTAATG